MISGDDILLAVIAAGFVIYGVAAFRLLRDLKRLDESVSRRLYGRTDQT